MNICLYCGKDTKNPKFCNRSHAASYNNKKFIKRLCKKYVCKYCNIEVAYRHTTCTKHNKNNVEWHKLTIADVKNRSKRRYKTINSHAKTVYENSGKPKHCIVCNYKKHYQVCHIKAISQFSETVMVAEVNAIDNLIALCPNCHWELDNNLLML